MPGQRAHLSSLLVVISLLALVFTGGCSFPGVYRIDVQQGNIIEREAIEKLETGMTRKQVEYLLGTPVIRNAFSPENEIYLYTIQLSGDEIHQQRVKVLYEGDTVAGIESTRLLHPDLANPGRAYKLKLEAE